jgi:hypothetical protein
MMLVKASKDSEAGMMPDESLIAAMTKYNEEMAKAGILLDLAGLQPSSKGARIKFSGGRPTVVDGPFAETKELVAGFWIVQGKSKEEIVERFTHAPFDGGAVIEIRQVFEAEDFGDNLPCDVKEQEQRLRERVK